MQNSSAGITSIRLGYQSDTYGTPYVSTFVALAHTAVPGYGKNRAETHHAWTTSCAKATEYCHGPTKR